VLAWSLYALVSLASSWLFPGLPGLREAAVPIALVEALALFGASTFIQLRLARLPPMASGARVARAALWAWLLGGLAAVALIECISPLVPGAPEARRSLAEVLGSRWVVIATGAVGVYTVLGGWLALSLGVRTFRLRAWYNASQLDALRYQLNPHFLFNTLNSLRGLIAESPPRAQQMVEQLADFLRYTLAPAPEGLLPLADELELAKRYLALEKIRFEENLEVSFTVDARCEGLVVPPMLLNPLVENAVKFGFRSSPSPLRIEVSALIEGQTLRMRVSNTGALVIPEVVGRQLGLKNVRARLELLFSGQSGLEIEAVDGWVHATVRIPVRQAITQ